MATAAGRSIVAPVQSTLLSGPITQCAENDELIVSVVPVTYPTLPPFVLSMWLP